MDGSTLTAEQVPALAASVRRQLRFWGRLRRRMDEVSISPAGRLYVVVESR